eukprot:1563254-Heterocapsa_arctica.AAC.1
MRPRQGRHRLGAREGTEPVGDPGFLFSVRCWAQCMRAPPLVPASLLAALQPPDKTPWYCLPGN